MEPIGSRHRFCSIGEHVLVDRLSGVPYKTGYNFYGVEVFVPDICIVRVGDPPTRTKRGAKVGCLLLGPALYFRRIELVMSRCVWQYISLER